MLDSRITFSTRHPSRFPGKGRRGALLALARVPVRFLAAVWLAIGLCPAPAADRPPAGSPSTDPASHWSFQPVTAVDPPSVLDAGRIRNPIDRFVQSRLEKAGLALQPPASRRTLIRRVTFDLTGLPPAPAEIRSFLNDAAPDAYERLVDRLLASPAFGVRAAQHWLDLARFAESDGFEHDKIRPESWRYRDWVINAMNVDLPYHRFVQMQVAGDLLPGDGARDAVATGFLVAGPDMPDLNLDAERRHQLLNEMVSTVGSVFMGLSVGCAQCHDHKFDPVSQREFYQLRAFFDQIEIPGRFEQIHHTVHDRPGPSLPSHVMIRGEFGRPGPPVNPAIPNALHSGNTASVPDAMGSRADLARWLTRPDHPLTARVMVNRLWLQHFGRGLVESPSDFGLRGAVPEYPGLLDWLAAELPRQGWSLKRIRRLMVLSATYRQRSFGSDEIWTRAVAVDPMNRWFSRMTPRRLTGEALRDSMLAVSGLLTPEHGGPGVRPPLPAEVTVTLLRDQWPVTAPERGHYRRSIYLFARRNLRFPMFEVFDRPDALASCARRLQSITAPQALTLLNSGFTRTAAGALARRLVRAADGDPGRGIDLAFAIAFGRSPDSAERTEAKAFLRDQRSAAETGDESDSGSPSNSASDADVDVIEPGDFEEVAMSAWTDFCVALFNANEFIHVD